MLWKLMDSVGTLAYKVLTSVLNSNRSNVEGKSCSKLLSRFLYTCHIHTMLFVVNAGIDSLLASACTPAELRILHARVTWDMPTSRPQWHVGVHLRMHKQVHGLMNVYIRLCMHTYTHVNTCSMKSPHLVQESAHVFVLCDWFVSSYTRGASIGHAVRRVSYYASCICSIRVADLVQTSHSYFLLCVYVHFTRAMTMTMCLCTSRKCTSVPWLVNTRDTFHDLCSKYACCMSLLATKSLQLLAPHNCHLIPS
jgi:hypothetical protein